MIVGFVLPWKYIMFGQPVDWKTRVNTAFYHLLFAYILHFLVANFISIMDEYH
jgi:hypothetical protein